MKQIPVIICIDVEPDEQDFDPVARSEWVGFLEAYKLMSSLRPKLEQATGSSVHFCWFLRMDPQIAFGYGSAKWVGERHGRILKELELKGDEVGLQMHAQRWDGASRTWIADYGNQEWVSNCLQSSFEAFQSFFGRPCESFRFGDYWINNDSVELIDKLGAKYDLTVEPGIRTTPSLSRLTGVWPDYSSAPDHPYRPSQDDYQRPNMKSGRKLWMIPLSGGRYEGPKALRLWRLKRIARGLGFDRQGHHEASRAALDIAPDIFRKLVEGLLKISNARYLAFVVRTDACIRTPEKFNLQENIDFLHSCSSVSRLRFNTPQNALALMGHLTDNAGQE